MSPALRCRLGFVAGLAWIVGLATAAPRYPIGDFARAPEYGQMQLSPDGASIAFLRELGGRSYLCIGPVGEPKVAQLVLKDVKAWGTVVPREVIRFRWLNDRRLLVTTAIWGMRWGVAAVDRDGTGWVGLTEYERDPSGRVIMPASEVIHVFNDPEASVLMLDRRETGGLQRLFPNVLKMNTSTGTSTTVVKNPGNVVAWEADHLGVVRAGIAREGTVTSVIYRDSADAPWRTLDLPQHGRQELRALGFDPIDGKFYVAGLNATERWTVLPFDTTTGTLGEPLFTDPEYDIVPDGGVPEVSGVSFGGLYFSRARQALVGVGYYTDAPRVRWLEPQFAAFQKAVDQALPDTMNLLAGQSRDDQQLLVFSFSDRDPGRYFLFDRAKKSFRPIGALQPWFKPADMAPMLAVKFQARDGLRLHGYLTVPVGHSPQQLPLVLLPHGGPWVRDLWGFDPLVQLLANRGYAVLQINYRGSPGYGAEFSLKGRRQIGRAIQDDIEDAARWAIRTGLAAPDRLAIVGGSYGGYSALFALGRSPDLYRCGVSINGVTDWLAIFKRIEDEGEYRFAREHWIEEIGDPEDDEKVLRAISPVNFAAQITAPVLIIQGKEDRTVPARQAKDMIAALEKAGRRPESYFVSGEGHGFRSDKAFTEVLTRVSKFLEIHLGPGVHVGE